jgi:hypothetical protein
MVWKLQRFDFDHRHPQHVVHQEFITPQKSQGERSIG